MGGGGCQVQVLCPAAVRGVNEENGNRERACRRAIKPPAGGQTHQLTALPPPYTSEKPMMPPTMEWVVLTGSSQ